MIQSDPEQKIQNLYSCTGQRRESKGKKFVHHKLVFMFDVVDHEAIIIAVLNKKI